ncbi:MAG: SPOR domain-containing protein [Bacteroidia bacterium]
MKAWLSTLLALGWSQQPWDTFRPKYRPTPLPSAELPRLGEPRPFEVRWQTSPTLQNLYDKVLHFNRTASTLPGYRIQVLTTPSRKIADSLRFFLLENYPQHSVYMLYEPPNYKLRVGDFLDRREAEEWLEHYRKDFSGAFVVPDKVLRP